MFDWVKNVLSNRKQYVFYNGEDSVEQDIQYGGHQDSILGPILFILHINELCYTTEKLFLLMTVSSYIQ